MRVLSFVVGLCAAAFATPTYSQSTMKLATYGTANNPVVKCGPLAVAQEIVAKSNGTLKLETHFTGSPFANPTKLYDQVARGIMDVTQGTVSFNPDRFPLTELIGMPFLVHDHVAGSRVANALLAEYLAQEFKDSHLLGLIVIAPQQFHMRRPLANIADLKGRRVRATGKATVAALERLGATVVVQPSVTQYENLQKGVIDGSVAAWAAIISFKVHEVAKYHVGANFGTVVAYYAMSKKFYASLSPDTKAVVDSEYTGAKIGARISNCWTAIDKAAIEIAKKAGNSLRFPDEKEFEETSRAVQPAIDSVLQELDGRGLKATEFYKTFKAALAKEQRK